MSAFFSRARAGQLLLSLLAAAFLNTSCEAKPDATSDVDEPVETEPDEPDAPRLDASTRRDAAGPAQDRDARTNEAEADTRADAATSRDASLRSDAGSDAAVTSSADCTLPPLAPGDHEYSIQSKNGLTYKYTLVVPATAEPMQRAPLALVWHALRSSPEETRGLTDVDARAAAMGAYSVHPRSPDQSWNTGSCCTATVLGLPRDELVFARELLAEVKTKVCVDDKRIYTTGFSNGGMMSQLLACSMSDVFAAAAPMGSTLTVDPNTCKPTRSIPMFMINGTADPLVGYSAPSLSGGLAVPASFQHWAAKDQCTGEPEVTLQKGKVTCKTYKQCAAGAEVTLCAVEGMGHCMPGMKEESPTNCFTKLIPLGQPNNDIDGMTATFDFFARFVLP